MNMISWSVLHELQVEDCRQVSVQWKEVFVLGVLDLLSYGGGQALLVKVQS